MFISGCSSVDDGEISLVFTGDVMLDRGVRQQIERKGIDHIFSAVKDSFLAADATVINLECPLTDVEDPQEKQFVF
ncbi:MAG: CapA family protein, partial [Clostridia bacterium]|nr:CapA family protein [Clostridia bacterium]